MGEKNKKQDTNKRIPIIILFVFVSAILLSFLYSLIQLIIKPSNIFIVDERTNISGRNDLSDML